MEILTWWFDQHWILSMLFMFPMSMVWHYFYGHTAQLMAGACLITFHICLRILVASLSVKK